MRPLDPAMLVFENCDTVMYTISRLYVAQKVFFRNCAQEIQEHALGSSRQKSRKAEYEH